jgi:hypothetical protein
MTKKLLLALFSIAVISFVNAQGIMNCGNFCVLSIGNLDTLANTVDVTIYNGDTNAVNYPTIVITDATGDTVANKTNYFYLFAHPAGDTLTQTIPSDWDSIPTGFTGTVYLTDQIWDSTCAYAYPMSCTVGIHEYASNAEFSVYPNPAAEAINIRLPKHRNASAEIALYDMTGRKARQLTTQESSVSIIRGDLRSGIYFVEIILDGKRLTKKIVLE